MRIAGIRLRDFRAFRNIELRDLPPLAVFVGANGTGKSTLVSVLQFLQEALTTNVTVALRKLGGFQAVRSRGSRGPIEIELTLREDHGVLVYALHLEEEEGRAFVALERLEQQLADGSPAGALFDFRRGLGKLAIGEARAAAGEREAPFEMQTLRSPDLLALKGLSQFSRLPAVAALGTFLEGWHFPRLQTRHLRDGQSDGNAERLSSKGENLALVIAHLQRRHPEILAKIIQRLARYVPGVEHIESKLTEEGRVLLRLKYLFEDPFFAREVSDGTLQMLAYLVLLFDPRPCSLIYLEEPEHHLYPTLLPELADELRAYTNRGGQVILSTHSPALLDAAAIEEGFWLVKRGGATEIRRSRDDAQLQAYWEQGDSLGALWKQGLFENADPR